MSSNSGIGGRSSILTGIKDDAWRIWPDSQQWISLSDADLTLDTNSQVSKILCRYCSLAYGFMVAMMRILGLPIKQSQSMWVSYLAISPDSSQAHSFSGFCHL